MPNNAALRVWVNELRSGNRQQATEALEQLDDQGNVVGQCCLGVACDLFKKEVGLLREVDQIVPTRALYDRAGEVLPYALVNYLGVDDDSVQIYLVGEPSTAQTYAYKPDDYYSLTEMNDGGMTFNQIADVIEYFIIDD